MRKLFIRLDDACPKRDISKWDRMELLLDKYSICPLVGIIPDCQDPDMEQYDEDSLFWSERIIAWKAKGWTFALHGYQHVFHTKSGGLNPVNHKSEFAGLPLSEQRRMIRKSIEILQQYGIKVELFFAPAHTFDRNTLLALESESSIRTISDTPANDIYKCDGFTFIPQQSGRVRPLPFKTITYCYHPNNMTEADFIHLESFIKQHTISSFEMCQTERVLTAYDHLLMKLYYWRHHA